MNRKLSLAFFPLFILILTFFGGCATINRNTLFSYVDTAFEAGSYDTARTLLDANPDQFYSDKDQVLYHLESGMLNYYAGSASDAVTHLNRAEILIEEYFTKSISQAAQSFLVNDLQMNYSGEDFEDIYLNIFKALSFLDMGDTDAAFVEVRRISNKLNLLEDKYEPLVKRYASYDAAQGVDIEIGTSRFYNSALARYLSLFMYRNEGNYDGARIDWQLLQEAFARQSNLYDFPIPFTEAAAVPAKGGRLSLIAFTGRSPVKLASTLWVHTYTDEVVIVAASEQDKIGRVLDSYLRFSFPDVKPGLRFKFEIPRMEMRGSQVERIRVTANGKPLGELGMLEDMQKITLDTFEIKEPMIFLRSAIRTLLKGLAADAAGSALEKSGSESGSLALSFLGYLGKLSLEVTAETSEQADLRVSRYFPAFAHAGEWELPPGDYRIRLEYFGSSGLLFTDDLGVVTLRPNRSSLLTSTFSR